MWDTAFTASVARLTLRVVGTAAGAAGNLLVRSSSGKSQQISKHLGVPSSHTDQNTTSALAFGDALAIADGVAVGDAADGDAADEGEASPGKRGAASKRAAGLCRKGW